MTTPTHSTIARINQALSKLTEADRMRVLQFTLGVVSDRAGKQAKRRGRFKEQGQAIDGWQIGH